MTNVIVPVGSNAMILESLDANGTNITQAVRFQAEADDPSTIHIGNPDPNIPNVFPFSAKKSGFTAHVTYTATNFNGDMVEMTDTVTVQTPPAGTMMLVYRPKKKRRK
jgi:hypothetical protein